MNQKKNLITTGGLHANFLIKSIAVASGIVKKFDFWDNSPGAHALNDEVIKFKEDFLDVQFIRTDYYNISHTKIDFLMLFDKNSLYKKLYHLNHAGGIAGTRFDLLNLNECFDNNISYTKSFLNCKPIDLNHTIVLKILNADSINSMREQIKLSLDFESTKKILLLLKNNEVKNIIWFDNFYNYTSFNNMILSTLHYLGLTYKVNLQDVYKIFYNKRKKIADSDNKVKNIFSNYFLKNKNINFNFTLCEQAYFDFLVENHYNKSIAIFYPNDQYPKNINDYVEFHKFKI